MFEKTVFLLNDVVVWDHFQVPISLYLPAKIDVYSETKFVQFVATCLILCRELFEVLCWGKKLKQIHYLIYVIVLM